ncbi:hypothetical protein LTR50_002748 [Elasticomyces elasticus]|nr:hypothetical protein LTR50_002748 [Elasticomyces elasticus]
MSLSLSDRELKILQGALKCAKNDIEVDYEKLSKEVNLKNAASARAAWCSLRKKLIPPNSNSKATDAAGAVGVTPRKRKGADGDATPKEHSKKSNVMAEDVAVKEGGDVTAGVKEGGDVTDGVNKEEDGAAERMA